MNGGSPNTDCVGSVWTCDGYGSDLPAPVQYTCTTNPVPIMQTICNPCASMQDVNCRDQCNSQGENCHEVCDQECVPGECQTIDVSQRCKVCDILDYNGQCVSSSYLTNYCVPRGPGWPPPEQFTPQEILPANTPSCRNQGDQWICCGSPITPATTCSIAVNTINNVPNNSTGFEEKGTVTTSNGKTIRRYQTKPGINYAGALTMNGSISNISGNVAVDVWRSATTPECWVGADSASSCPTETAFSQHTTSTNTLTTNFDTTSVEAGSYYVSCNAYQQFRNLSIKYQCAGDPYSATFPTTDGRTYCGDNSRVLIQVFIPLAKPLKREYNAGNGLV